MDYTLNLDLKKLNGAAICDLKGQNATKRCLILPIEDAQLYETEKGCYLSLIAKETQNNQYGNSHYVKVSLNKAKREGLTDEELKKVAPIIGNTKEYKFEPKAQQPINDDNMPLPF